jgi:hypothetical protein
MFQYPDRKAIATATPVNSKGVAATSTSSRRKSLESGVRKNWT